MREAMFKRSHTRAGVGRKTGETSSGGDRAPKRDQCGDDEDAGGAPGERDHRRASARAA